MRPRKRDFRGDARKRAKNYDTVSSDDSEVYRRKDPFAGRNRKRPSGRRATIPKYIVEKILSQGGTGSARPAGGRNLKGCASLQSKPDELREGKQTDNLLYSDKSKKRDRSNVECSKRRRATIRIRLFVM